VKVHHGPPRPGEQREALADTRKAARELGWTPGTSIEDGLRAQLEWQRREWERNETRVGSG
jgi:UDP-glucose 4-epimerase